MPPIAPRPGDGRISRADAALLAGVENDTISSWICKGWLTDIRREGRRVWLMPAEVIQVEHRVHMRPSGSATSGAGPGWNCSAPA